ncbi:hypothetical protein IU485_28375 [Nocardia cyriacigeorgica]|uniref:hypothetical protein n=1 Tax=Nocardia cyriacigeorgica TaxID=135487 RepID=UPI0018941400|nr:hypothetical protein [Nocardia cyriacigeorgica]MBF6085290.1 hypothetical protein [Nocardia cyriacigeorgica]
MIRHDHSPYSVVSVCTECPWRYAGQSHAENAKAGAAHLRDCHDDPRAAELARNAANIAAFRQRKRTAQDRMHGIPRVDPSSSLAAGAGRGE